MARAKLVIALTIAHLIFALLFLFVPNEIKYSGEPYVFGITGISFYSMVNLLCYELGQEVEPGSIQVLGKNKDKGEITTYGRQYRDAERKHKRGAEYRNWAVMGYLLLFVAYILAGILFPVGIFFTAIKGTKHANKQFKKVAISVDQTGNVICADLFDLILIKEGGYRFGNPDMTISGVLGINEKQGTLSRFGSLINWLICLISGDKFHSLKAIEEDEQ